MSNTRTELNMVSPMIQFTIYVSYGLILFLGYLRDFMDRYIFNTFTHPKEGYAPLTRDFEEFFRRRAYGRIVDCFNRPITGPAAGTIKVLKKNFKNGNILNLFDLKNTSCYSYFDDSRKYLKDEKMKMLEMEMKREDEESNNNQVKLFELPTFNESDVINSLNLASYNYLGFGQPGHKLCEKNVMNAIDQYGISTCSPPYYSGYTSIHKKLETTVSNFLNVEDAMVFGMGWGTNATAIPALVGKGCLIISDSKNHNSIVTGARTSGAKIKRFIHNDHKQLEKMIRKYIVEGQPRTHRPWKKILIIIEGVYSMEGEMCCLREIVAIKKKYKCYLYLDEAHSIGSVGKTGRGVCDFFNVNTKDIDILMGTFTKSFGAIGGYIAGKKEFIKLIRSVCASTIHSSGLSPICCAQIQTAFEVIDSDEGRKRIKHLHKISDYMREKLRHLGFAILGNNGNAVIPLLLCLPGKMAVASRVLLSKGYAIVVVGFPAVQIGTDRVRFCLSANHTMEQIKKFCNDMSEIGDLLNLKYTKRTLG